MANLCGLTESYTSKTYTIHMHKKHTHTHSTQSNIVWLTCWKKLYFSSGFFSLPLSLSICPSSSFLYLNIEHAGKVFYIRSQKKNPQLVYNGYIFNKKQTQANGHTTWRCIEMAKTRCRAVCITQNSQLMLARRSHHHDPHWGRFSNRELYTTEHEADKDSHRDVYVHTPPSPPPPSSAHNTDPKIVVVGFWIASQPTITHS